MMCGVNNLSQKFLNLKVSFNFGDFKMRVELSREIFTYRGLLNIWRKGVRSGNWARLAGLEKGLFRCAVLLAKVRGRISNLRLMVHIAKIAIKILVSVKTFIIRIGRMKAQAYLNSFNLMFEWCENLREWLKDPNYIFYLGAINYL